MHIEHEVEKTKNDTEAMTAANKEVCFDYMKIVTYGADEPLVGVDFFWCVCVCVSGRGSANFHLLGGLFPILGNPCYL